MIPSSLLTNNTLYSARATVENFVKIQVSQTASINYFPNTSTSENTGSSTENNSTSQNGTESGENNNGQTVVPANSTWITAQTNQIPINALSLNMIFGFLCVISAVIFDVFWRENSDKKLKICDQKAYAQNCLYNKNKSKIYTLPLEEKQRSTLEFDLSMKLPDSVSNESSKTPKKQLDLSNLNMLSPIFSPATGSPSGSPPGSPPATSPRGFDTSRALNSPKIHCSMLSTIRIPASKFSSKVAVIPSPQQAQPDTLRDSQDSNGFQSQRCEANNSIDETSPKLTSGSFLSILLLVLLSNAAVVNIYKWIDPILSKTQQALKLAINLSFYYLLCTICISQEFVRGVQNTGLEIIFIGLLAHILEGLIAITTRAALCKFHTYFKTSTVKAQNTERVHEALQKAGISKCSLLFVQYVSLLNAYSKKYQQEKKQKQSSDSESQPPKPLWGLLMKIKNWAVLTFLYALASILGIFKILDTMNWSNEDISKLNYSVLPWAGFELLYYLLYATGLWGFLKLIEKWQMHQVHRVLCLLLNFFNITTH